MEGLCVYVCVCVSFIELARLSEKYKSIIRSDSEEIQQH